MRKLEFFVNLISSIIGAFIGFYLVFHIISSNSIDNLSKNVRDLEMKVWELCGYVEISNCFDKHFLYGDKCVYTCNDGRIVENAKECNKCKDMK